MANKKIRIITVMAKCSDMCTARLSEDGFFMADYEGYVPAFLNLVDGDEDYIGLRIDADTGQILNWKKLTQAQIKETFFKL